TPKPLIKIGDVPIIIHIMNHFSRYGFNDFLLCAGYKKELFYDYFEKNPNKKWNVKVLDTGEDSETASRVLTISSHLGERFFLTYGDGISNVNLNELLKYHEEKKVLTTITGINPISQYGVIEVENGLAIKFNEKPKMDEIINGGYMVMEKKVIEYFRSNESIEEGPLNRLVNQKELAVFKHEDFWKGIDTEKDVETLNDIWNQGEIPWITNSRR
ncbi:sugar phosphate nucleotidyltransferase, partial [Planococcus sp. MB-3u-03]